MRLTVNGSVSVHYLPGSPDKARLDPTTKLEGFERSESQGTHIFGAGLIFLVLTAIWHAVSSRKAGPVQSVYRISMLLPSVGFLFFMGGIYAQVAIVLQIASGRAVPYTNSVNGHITSEGVLSPVGSFFAALFPILFWGLGLLLLLYGGLKYRVTTTEAGIRIDGDGKKPWESKWEDLKFVRSGNRGTVVSNGQTEGLLYASILQPDKLEQEMRRHVPDWPAGTLTRKA